MPLSSLYYLDVYGCPPAHFCLLERADKREKIICNKRPFLKLKTRSRFCLSTVYITPCRITQGVEGIALTLGEMTLPLLAKQKNRYCELSFNKNKRGELSPRCISYYVCGVASPKALKVLYLPWVT